MDVTTRGGVPCEGVSLLWHRRFPSAVEPALSIVRVTAVAVQDTYLCARCMVPSELSMRTRDDVITHMSVSPREGLRARRDSECGR